MEKSIERPGTATSWNGGGKGAGPDCVRSPATETFLDQAKRNERDNWKILKVKKCEEMWSFWPYSLSQSWVKWVKSIVYHIWYHMLICSNYRQLRSLMLQAQQSSDLPITGVTLCISFVFGELRPSCATRWVPERRHMNRLWKWWLQFLTFLTLVKPDNTLVMV